MFSPPGQKKKELHKDIVGRGKDACVLKGSLGLNCFDGQVEKLCDRQYHPHELVTKVSLNKREFDKEVANAMILSDIDSEQEYFIYPIAKCTRTAPLIPEIHNDCGFPPVPEQSPTKSSQKKKRSVPPTSPKLLHMLEMHNAGISLERMIENKMKLTESQARKIIADVTNALTLLHSKGYIHKDLHYGNVVVKFLPNGKVRGYLIDFAKMRKYDVSDTTDKNEEVQDFIRLILLSAMNQVLDDGKFVLLDHTNKEVKSFSYMNVKDVKFGYVSRNSPTIPAVPWTLPSSASSSKKSSNEKEDPPSSSGRPYRGPRERAYTMKPSNLFGN